MSYVTQVIGVYTETGIVECFTDWRGTVQTHLLCVIRYIMQTLGHDYKTKRTTILTSL